jgi:hypothetical protein
MRRVKKKKKEKKSRHALFLIFCASARWQQQRADGALPG